MLSGRHGVPERSVHYDYSPRRRTLDIDVIDADSGPAHNAQICARVQNPGRDLRGGANCQSVEPVDDLGELLLGKPHARFGLDPPLVEQLLGCRAQLVGDEDPRHGTPPRRPSRAMA